MIEKSDEELILDFQAGNAEAIAVLFGRYKRGVFNFSFRLIGNRAEAEDATAEVFLSLFKKQYLFVKGAKFSTWLYTIARNSSISRLRKQNKFLSLWSRRNPHGETVLYDVADPSPSSQEDIMKKENVKQIQQAIAKLDIEQRQAIVLREYQHCSYEEIAQVMGCSLEKVKILLFRARERLRGELTPFLSEGQS